MFNVFINCYLIDYVLYYFMLTKYYYKTMTLIIDINLKYVLYFYIVYNKTINL